MQTNIKKKPNNTYEVEVTVSKDKVNAAFNEALRHEAEHAEIQGFRKGKAPLNVVKDNVDKSKFRGHALNRLLTDIYSRIVKENKFEPILQPRFDIKEFAENKDAFFVITIIEKPEIKLGDYKKALKELAQKKKAKGDEFEITNQEIVDVILKTSEIGVSEKLIEEEVNRMMSALIDQTARLGITIDQYLESHKKTPEQLRLEYTRTAESTLKADFLVTEIAIKEEYKVEDDEIEKTIAAVPDEASRKVLAKPKQRMYIKAVLLKNKTLQNLTEYAKSSVEATKSHKNKKGGSNQG